MAKCTMLQETVRTKLIEAVNFLATLADNSLKKDNVLINLGRVVKPAWNVQLEMWDMFLQKK